MKNLLNFCLFLVIMKPVLAQPPDTASAVRELPDQRTFFSKTYYNGRANTYTTRISPSYVHYLASDGTFKDIDTNLRLDKSGAYYIIDSGLYNAAFTGDFSKGNWDVAYEIPRPVKQKFQDPGKPRPPVTRMRWKVLSYGYWEAQKNRYQILEYAQSVPPVVSGNAIDYPEIFSGIDIRYICGNVSVKEEIVLSQFGRDNLPDPAQYGLSRANTYFVVAMEFFLTPANINVFARRQTGKTPIKQGNGFGFDGDDPIEFEDADSTLHFFFPKDYAYAAADSVTDFSNRVSMRRYFYSDRGKDYMLVGVPWSWVNSAPEGDLIIDPTTNAATSEDVRLYDGNNYGNETRLAVGKFPNASQYKTRTLINFNLSGIPSNATVLRATMNLKYFEAVNYGGGTWVDRWVQAHQMLVSWNEAQATKDNRLTGTAWNATYGAINGTDAASNYESTVLFWQSELSQLPVWKSWDLTALTQEWVNTSTSNYGVILWATNEDVAGYTFRFHSSEASNSSDRPYLEVVYSTDAATKTVYFLKDHLGSIRATVLDSAGAPVIGYDDYDPWGYPLALRTKAIPNAYLQGASKNKFTGKEYDDELGLNWVHFPVGRKYMPDIARWTTPDPLWQKHPDVSPYAYVLNNPMILVDPDGQQVRAGINYKIPSWAEIQQNLVQSKEQSKAYASEGRYAMAVGNYIWGLVVAFGETDAAGISGLASAMTIPEKVAATGAALVDDAARAVSKTANATDKVVSAAEKGTKVFGSLSDGMKTSTDDALQKAIDYLGEGYKDLGNGRYISSDGLRQVRMGDSDILGKHGGGPHINFEKLAPNPDKLGKMKVVENKHIFLEGK